MRKKGVVVLDCDGTLTPKEIRSLMYCVDNAALTAEGARRGQEMRDFYLPIAVAGTLTAEQEAAWLRGTLQLYVDDRLTMGRVRQALAAVPLRPGAADCLRLLRSRDVPVAVISYGVAAFVEAFLEAHGVRDCVQAVYSAELFADGRDGPFIGFSEDSFVFPSNKGIWSRRFARRCRMPTEKIYAVGDSLGDKRLGNRKDRRLALAKDPAEAAKLAPHMGQVIVSASFEPVTAWLKEKLDLA